MYAGASTAVSMCVTLVNNPDSVQVKSICASCGRTEETPEFACGRGKGYKCVIFSADFFSFMAISSARQLLGHWMIRFGGLQPFWKVNTLLYLH